METEPNPPKSIADLAKSALIEIKEPSITQPITRPVSTDASIKTANSWTQKWIGLQPWHPEISRLSDCVARFCNAWFRGLNPYLLVLAGPSGCGKSHAMKGAHKWTRQARIIAAENGSHKWPHSVLWSQWPELVRPIVESATHMADALLDPISTDLLFLDDIGAESDKFRSAENTDALCQLLSRREHKWTILSTNFRPQNWPEKFDARVSDRLLRNSVLCDIACGSFSMR